MIIFVFYGIGFVFTLVLCGVVARVRRFDADWVVEGAILWPIALLCLLIAVLFSCCDYVATLLIGKE